MKSCLNPCCNGRWSRTTIQQWLPHRLRVLILVVMEDGLVLQPSISKTLTLQVLILVVMEDGLVPNTLAECMILHKVLILVVMEDGLVLAVSFPNTVELTSLNPCCNGRWSRT